MTPRTIYELTPELADQLAEAAARKVVGLQAQQKQLEAAALVQYYTAAQGAAIVGVNVQTLRKYAREGLIKQRPGKEVEKYHISDLLNLQAQRINLKKIG